MKLGNAVILEWFMRLIISQQKIVLGRTENIVVTFFSNPGSPMSDKAIKAAICEHESSSRNITVTEATLRERASVGWFYDLVRPVCFETLQFRLLEGKYIRCKMRFTYRFFRQQTATITAIKIAHIPHNAIGTIINHTVRLQTVAII